MKSISDDISAIQPRYLRGYLGTTLEHSPTVQLTLRLTQLTLAHSQTYTRHRQTDRQSSFTIIYVHTIHQITLSLIIHHHHAWYYNTRIHQTLVEERSHDVIIPLKKLQLILYTSLLSVKHRSMEDVSIDQCNNGSFMGLNHSLQLTMRSLLLQNNGVRSIKVGWSMSGKDYQCGFVSLFRSVKVMGVIMLDPYDFLWRGDWIEPRSGGVQRRCGARVIEWSIGCSSDVGVNVQVWRRKWLCDVGVYVALM